MKQTPLTNLLTAAALLSTAGHLAVAEPADPQTNIEEIFMAPPDWAKPSGYWWWINAHVDKEAITRDLEQFKAKGMGAVLLVNSGNWGGWMPVKGPAYLSEEWRALYRYALQEAHRLGIKVDVNIAPGWNMGGPWVTKDKACRWFVQSEMTIEGPQSFSGNLPVPDMNDGYDPNANFNTKPQLKVPFEKADYRDTAVVAFRSRGKPTPRKDLQAKSNRLDGNCFVPASKVMGQTLVPWKASKADHPISPEDVIDLSSKLQPDGGLDWEVPDGRWTIVRTGHRMTGADLEVPAPGMAGLEADHLDRAGVELMFEEVGKVLIAEAGPLAGNTLRAFCTDSFECGYPNWSDNMIERFKHYRGYDPAPYLPVFKGWIVGSAEISERFLHDYRKSVADCFADEHYGRFTELCREHGMKTRCEPAGPTWSGTMCMDGLKNLGRVDYPQGEYWRELFFEAGQNKVGKMTASGAHIYGKRTASAEALTFGKGNWSGIPQNVKPFVDRAFCEGINNNVFVIMTCQRPQDGKPGYEFGAGTYFNPNVTWWDQAAKPWLDYNNRCQALLQSGLFVADVLYYNGDWAPNLVRPKGTERGLGKGYDYDVCNAEVLLTRLSVKDGKLVLPDGMSYRVLVLPESDRMPAEVIRKLEELVRAGATVIGPRPVSDPGLKNYPECDETVRKVAATLWGKIDGKSVFENRLGKGRVIEGKTAREVLLADGVGPGIEVSGNPKTFIDFIHRATTDADFYFLANRNPQAEQVEVSFRQSGRQPELWNPVDGSRRDLPEFTEKDGHTSVPLQFEPHGSMFVVFRKPAAKAEGRNFPALETVAKVEGPWIVRFDREWFYPVEGLEGANKEGVFAFGKLVDWAKHPEPAVKHFTGTAVYEAEFVLDQAPVKGKHYWLDIGRANASASVKLNGVDLGVVWCEPWRVDATRALRKGANKLEIEVVNRWTNRLIGDVQLPKEQRRTFTNITNPFKVDSPLLESGLLGPVTMTVEDRTE